MVRFSYPTSWNVTAVGAAAVTSSQPVSAGDSALPVRTEPVSPLKNPSYPQRIHLSERAHWQEVLRSCEAKIAEARAKLDAIKPGPQRAELERFHAQMLGARD